jgi:ParB/RepB/Spo0J family partition protein
MADTKTTAAKTAEIALPGEQIVWLSLSDVDADYGWNGRSGAWEKDDAGDKDDDEAGEKGDFSNNVSFPKFKSSIAVEGQDTPMFCRQALKAGGKVRLVSGFRRHRAISELASEKREGSNPAFRGLLKVIVREMNDAQARAMNIRENVARSSLRKADLAWSILDLAKTGETDSSIALTIGKSQPYVSKLHVIATKLQPKVLKMWRDANHKITVNQIEKISEMQNQEELLVAALSGSDGEEGGESTRGPDGWKVTKKKEAEKIGHMLGRLAARDVIDVAGVSADSIVDVLIEFPPKYYKSPPKDQKPVRNKCIRACEKGITEGVAAEKKAMLEEVGSGVDEEE